MAIQTVLSVGGQQHFKYHPDKGFCYGVSSSSSWLLADVIVRTVELALPIPISVISCVVSTLEVMRFMKRGSARSILLKRHATVTIILITVVFLVLNLPAFIIYLLRLISLLDPVHSDLFTSQYMQFYSWGVVRVVLYSMNAMLNPIVYILRIRYYRTWIKKNSGELSRRISSLGSGFNNVSPIRSTAGLKRVQSQSVVIANTVAVATLGKLTPPQDRLTRRRRSRSVTCY